MAGPQQACDQQHHCFLAGGFAQLTDVKGPLLPLLLGSLGLHAMASTCGQLDEAP